MFIIGLGWLLTRSLTVLSSITAIGEAGFGGVTMLSNPGKGLYIVIIRQLIAIYIDDTEDMNAISLIHLQMYTWDLPLVRHSQSIEVSLHL